MDKQRYLEVTKKICSLFPLGKKEPAKGYCYVMSSDLLWVIMNPKYVTARVIASEEGCPVIAVNNKKEKFRERIAKEYGFDTKSLGDIGVSRTILCLLKAFIFMLRVKPQKLEKVKIDGILVGDLICDTIIRRNLKVYTINSILNIHSFKVILKAHLMIELCHKLFGKYKPRYLIAQDWVYLEAIYTRMGKYYGADVIMLTTGKPSHVIKSNAKENRLFFSVSYYDVLQPLIANPDTNWKISADQMLEDLFKGKGDWNVANAYENKIVASRKTVLSKIGIHNEKKNIVIMSHVFSDDPHCTEKMLYRDYYTWLTETLKLTKGIDEVNWILKPHPGRASYQEDGVVEELYQKYKHSSLYWMPDEFSTLVLREIADVIVTVSGSAGYELSCLGIPVVCTGRPFYSYFGYTINPQTVDEYKKILQSINKIEKLDENKIEIAKLVFYAYNKCFSLEDTFAKESWEIHDSYHRDYDIALANHNYLRLLEKTLYKENFGNIYDVRYAKDLIHL